MGQATNYLEGKIIDHLLKTSSYSPPATSSLYVALGKANPTADGSGWSEVVYTGYARQVIPFGAATARGITQNALVSFPLCTGAPSGPQTGTYFGVFDDLTAGNLLAYGVLTPSKVITIGNTPSIANGQVNIQFTAGVIFTGIANSILDWVFRGQSLAQPTNVKLALSTTTPADDGTNINEPSGQNYAKVNCNAWDAAAGNPRAAGNSSTITLGPPSGSWGSCTYGVIYLDTTPFMRSTINTQTPDNGDIVEWLAGQFSVGIQ